MIVSARVAARVRRLLTDAVRQAHAAGERLDEETVATVAGIERAGRWYVESQARPSSVNGTSEPDLAELPSESEPHGYSTTEAADRLGCGERNVVKLISAQRLSARRVGRTWLIEPASLARLVDDRRSSA